MQIKAVNLTKVVRHQLSFDDAIGTDKAVTWILGALDARVLGAIKDKATGIPMSALSGTNADAVATLNINQTNFDIVLFGLKGIEGLTDDEDKPFPFKTTHTNLNGKTYLTADPAVIEALPAEVIEELASTIMDLNTLKETERKNSDE